MEWLIYIGVGIATFFVIRAVFKKAALDVRSHDKIWAFALNDPIGWIMVVLVWPIFAIVSLLWLAADLLHLQGRKEVQSRNEKEAKRDKRYEHLDLMQKIDLLESEAERTRKRQPNKPVQTTAMTHPPSATPPAPSSDLGR